MALEINNLSIGFDGQALFANLFGKVEAGESLAILGCNGTGKSSLLSVIAGVSTPICGSINKDVPQSKVAYLVQTPNIRRDVPITIDEYIKFAELCGKLPSKDNIIQIYEKLGLTPIANEFLSNISGGQMVFANLARIALTDAQIIILDEPFASLDKDAAQILLSLIDDFRKQGRIIIVSIHDDRLAQNFDHFLTLDGKTAFWEKNCPNHSENCVLSHNHNHFHHHILEATK